MNVYHHCQFSSEVSLNWEGRHILEGFCHQLLKHIRLVQNEYILYMNTGRAPHLVCSLDLVEADSYTLRVPLWTSFITFRSTTFRIFFDISCWWSWTWFRTSDLKQYSILEECFQCASCFCCWPSCWRFVLPPPRSDLRLLTSICFSQTLLPMRKLTLAKRRITKQVLWFLPLILVSS